MYDAYASGLYPQTQYGYSPYGGTFPQVQPQQRPLQQPQQIERNIMPCKFVDSYDTAKIQEVPMGGYGIFPKADMSAIYLKSWLNDGSTRILSYLPVVESEDANSTNDKESKINELFDAISRLEKKIDVLGGGKS